jgi:hypothetical protein
MRGIFLFLNGFFFSNLRLNIFSCKFDIRFIYVNVVSQLILNGCSSDKGVWVGCFKVEC